MEATCHIGLSNLRMSVLLALSSSAQFHFKKHFGSVKDLQNLEMTLKEARKSFSAPFCVLYPRYLSSSAWGAIHAKYFCSSALHFDKARVFNEYTRTKTTLIWNCSLGWMVLNMVPGWIPANTQKQPFFRCHTKPPSSTWNLLCREKQTTTKNNKDHVGQRIWYALIT